MRNLIGLVLAMSLNSFAQSSKPASTSPEILPKYQVGAGARYELKVGSEPTEVTIGFIESSNSKLIIEIAMKSLNDKESLNVKMWQQFHLGLEAGKIKILKGIMKIPMVDQPQILPPEYLEGYDGAQVKSFLIGSADELDGKKIGHETVTAGDKTYETTHYRHEENGQVIDYWISERAKPLSLVKMESTGKTPSQNYKMLLKGPVSGVKAQINANEAVPLNDAAKTFLPLLLPSFNKL